MIFKGIIHNHAELAPEVVCVAVEVAVTPWRHSFTKTMPSPLHTRFSSAKGRMYGQGPFGYHGLPLTLLGSCQLVGPSGWKPPGFIATRGPWKKKKKEKNATGSCNIFSHMSSSPPIHPFHFQSLCDVARL